MIELESINERLIAHACVCLLHVDIERDTLKYNILLTLSESEETNSAKLTLQFFDVSNFKVSEFGGGLTQFMHLKISCINAGLDRVKYEISDIEDGKIYFCFSSFEDLS